MEVHGQGEGADHAGRAFAETLAVELARSADLTILRVPESTEAGSSGGSAGVKAALDAGAGRLVSGTLNRAGNNLHASITLLDTTRGRVIWGLRKEAAGDSLSSLASTLASELTAHLGGKRPRQYGHFSYSTESRALANSPEWVEAVGATRRFEVEAASRATRRLMEIFPAEPDSRVLRSNALLFEAWGMPASSPQFAQFQASLADIHRVDPDNPWDEVLGAFARKQRGAHREAVEQLTSVLSREDLTPAARAFILSLRGDAKAYDNDYTGAFADLNGALELDPANNVNYLTLAAALLRVGRIEEGFARARQAVALVPTSAPNNDQLGRSLLMMGRYEESLAPMKKACEGRRIYCTGYGRALSLAGHPDQALPRLAELCDSAPPDASRWAFSAASNCIEYACALAREGQVQKAHAAARKADGSPEQQELLYGKARYRALAGDRAEAIRLLKRSVELGLVVGWIDQDPDFVSLHGDPDFAAVVSQVKERLSYP
jgi:tetratricopeptide (TPR) repeat protein/TolB-like protein